MADATQVPGVWHMKPEGGWRFAPEQEPSPPGGTVGTASSSPGFLGGLLDVLKNLKIAVGPQSVIRSGQLPGMSYNDLFAPARERREAEDLTDMYIDLGENMLGMDMGPVKRIREQQKARGTPPSLGFSKALQGLVQQSFQYGHQRPLGAAVAEQMFPSTVTTTTSPTGGLPPIYQQREGAAAPAPAWQAPTGLTDLLGGEAPWQPAPTTPGETTTTSRELTPLQQIIKQQVARGRPADVARMLPSIAEHFPGVLEGGMPGDAKAEQKRLIDEIRAANPDMSPTLYNMLLGMNPHEWRGPRQQQSLRQARTWLHEDRQVRRFQNAPLRAEQDRYTTAVMQLPLSREQQQRALDEIAATTTEQQPRQVYARYVGQAPAQDPEQRRRDAMAQFNSTLNIYMPRMDPADATRWRSQAGQARTAEDVYALEQQMGQTIPAQAPLTAQQTWQHEQQVAQHEQQLMRGFLDNMSKLNTVSGYLKGTIPHEQAGYMLNLPGAGTLPVPSTIFSPTRPTTRPAPNTAQVQRFFETAFITLGRQIQNIRNLGKANPARAQEYDALATEYTQTLNDMQADYAGQLQGAGAPAGTAAPTGTRPGAATGNPLRLAMQEVLGQRGLTEVPKDAAQLKEVLDAVYHTMVQRNYNPAQSWVKDLQAVALKQRGYAWTPPAAP